MYIMPRAVLFLDSLIIQHYITTFIYNIKLSFKLQHKSKLNFVILLVAGNLFWEKRIQMLQ